LVRDPAKYPDRSGRIEIVNADLLKPDTLKEALTGVEKAFIVAQPTPELMTMEANAFIAARDAGIKHIVHLSNFRAGTPLPERLAVTKNRDHHKLRNTDGGPIRQKLNECRTPLDQTATTRPGQS